MCSLGNLKIRYLDKKVVLVLSGLPFTLIEGSPAFALSFITLIILILNTRYVSSNYLIIRFKKLPKNLLINQDSLYL